EHLPKEVLGHLRGPFPIGVGKPVAARGARTTNTRQRSRVQWQRIAPVIETDAMGPLRIGQADHLAPRGERARLILRPGSARNFGDQCWGIKLQTCRKMLNWDRVGLSVFFFIPALW